MPMHLPTPEEIEAAFAALLAGPVVGPVDQGPSSADLPLLLRLANARVEEQLRRVAEDVGLPDLSPAAVHTLRVCDPGGKRLVSIAGHLCVSRQAAGQVVDRLEKHGLVERVTTDRGALVMRTDEGSAVVREVTAALTELVETWMVGVRGERLEQLCADLGVLSEPPGARWRNVGD